MNLASEVIALKLRRSGSFERIFVRSVFAGLSGAIAGLCLFELWRVIRERKQNAAEETSVFTETQEEINGARNEIHRQLRKD